MNMLCTHIKAHFPSSPCSAQLFCLHCTRVWLFCCKTYLLSSPNPKVSWYNSTNWLDSNILWTRVKSTNTLMKLSSPALVVGITVQIIPRLHLIMDMRQAHKYPDSTISKVLSVLKWWTITTLNRKLLEKQRVYNRFGFYEVHIGHFFYNVNQCHCQFWKSFNPVYIQI